MKITRISVYRKESNYARSAYAWVIRLTFMHNGVF